LSQCVRSGLTHRLIGNLYSSISCHQNDRYVSHLQHHVGVGALLGRQILRRRRRLLVLLVARLVEVGPAAFAAATAASRRAPRRPGALPLLRLPLRRRFVVAGFVVRVFVFRRIKIPNSNQNKLLKLVFVKQKFPLFLQLQKFSHLPGTVV
jgi:hypothetical protein